MQAKVEAGEEAVGSLQGLTKVVTMKTAHSADAADTAEAERWAQWAQRRSKKKDLKKDLKKDPKDPRGDKFSKWRREIIRNDSMGAKTDSTASVVSLCSWLSDTPRNSGWSSGRVKRDSKSLNTDAFQLPDGFQQFPMLSGGDAEVCKGALPLAEEEAEEDEPLVCRWAWNA